MIHLPVTMRQATILLQFTISEHRNLLSSVTYVMQWAILQQTNSVIFAQFWIMQIVHCIVFGQNNVFLICKIIYGNINLHYTSQCFESHCVCERTKNQEPRTRNPIARTSNLGPRTNNQEPGPWTKKQDPKIYNQGPRTKTVKKGPRTRGLII